MKKIGKMYGNVDKNRDKKNSGKTSGNGKAANGGFALLMVAVLVLAAAVLPLPALAYVSQGAAGDTLGYWRFNDNTDTTLDDSGGRGNTGTMQNMVLGDYVTGIFGYGLDFDGTNDYVSVPNHASLNPTAAITIEQWVKNSPPSYGSPSGTAITTVTELQNMKNDLTADYYLANDIDASATSGWNGGLGFEPVGYDQHNEFIGTFDGQGHKITNLYINRTSDNYAGLFGYVGWGGIIKNVGLEDVNITNSYHYVGSLVGIYYGGSGSSVTNCYSTGTVTSPSSGIGGLVGYGGSVITDSYSACTVNGGSRAGGLLGYAICGSDITNCYASGSVTGTGSSVGGLVGQDNCGIITNSYSSGSVTGTGSVGGLVGNDDGATVINSYASGSVTGTSSVGGLVGSIANFMFGGTITNSYSTGFVTGSSQVGGLVGKNADGLGTITDSYWDTQTSDQPTSDGGTGKTTLQMKQQATFANWDFTDIWGIEEAVTYPFEQWQWDYAGSKGRDAYSLQFNREGSTLYGFISNNEITTPVSNPANWHHIAMTFDGTDQKLFVDGVLKTTTTPGGAIGTNSNSFDIGGAFKGYFDGIMDEVRILNYARTGFSGGVMIYEAHWTGDNKWIGICNYGGASVDIRGWKFVNDTGQVLVDFSTSHTISAGTYEVLYESEYGGIGNLAATDSIRVYDLDPKNDGTVGSAGYTNLVDFVAWGGSCPGQCDASTDDAVKAGLWTEGTFENPGGDNTVYLYPEKRNDRAVVDWSAKDASEGSAPVPELPTAILFAVGLVVMVGYVVLQRRQK